jgi:hypothetical protein
MTMIFGRTSARRATAIGFTLAGWFKQNNFSWCLKQTNHQKWHFQGCIFELPVVATKTANAQFSLHLGLAFD